MSRATHLLGLTEHRDLRGGSPLWTSCADIVPVSSPLPDREVEIAIVGAGVMGAMIADRLTAGGRNVLLLDRRPPGHGATAASTALVMWAADVPLSTLAGRIGEREAARRWRRVHQANRSLAERIDVEGIACGRADHPELYLAGSLLDPEALRTEAAIRERHGLPSSFITANEVADRFGIAPCDALLSDGSFGLDPVELTLALVHRARQGGASLHFPADVVGLVRDGRRTILSVDGGTEVAARTVILAPGYERARLFLPSDFAVSSSFAISAKPAGASPWREGALIWEASSPYFYARTTSDGLVVSGGEDEDFDDDLRRDALIGGKSGLLLNRLEALTGTSFDLDHAWSASFGSSPDGLPAIGQVEHDPNLWIAAGFGGNGVTFAALAADIVASALEDTPDPDAACFDPYRFAR